MPHFMIVFIPLINLSKLSWIRRCLFLRSKEPLTDSEDLDQTARMRRLIWAFAVRICPKTRFRMVRSKWASTWESLTCTSDEESNQPLHSRSLISLRCLHEETASLAVQNVSRFWSVCTECASWSESYLSVHVRRYVYWRGGSNISINQ